MRLLARVLPLVLVALVFCAPLFMDLRSVDQENDEAIYSYAAESIVQTGDWMNPRSSPTADTVFLEKPPLKFWIVALPIRLGLLPDDDFGLRFWDPVMGSLAFLYIFAFARRMGGWLAGVVALLMMYTLSDLIFSHGLRSNTMEAAVVLAYTGGLYHYLRWAECENRGWSRAHAAAVGAYFFLGFMTKFVAAVFLPAVIGAASLELPAIRSKVLREWRTWLAVAAGVVALAAPWFVYQSLQPGRGIWAIMFGEHVVTRFKSSLDPAHLHPWYYYFQFLVPGLVNAGTIWLVAPGAVLIHLRVIRERWLAGTLVLYWFWLPFVVISFGSSKLWHYTYPFLPPVGLAAGYFVGRLATAGIDRIRMLTDPARSQRLGVPARLAGALPRLGGAARVLVPIILLCFMPIADYRQVVHRTGVQAHPMRSTRDCVAEVRRNEQAAGRPVGDMLVFLPARTFNHTYFFYFRTFGWDRRDDLPDALLKRTLDEEQRPVLLPDELFSAFRQGNDPPGTERPAAPVARGLVVALPGPYGRCAF